MNRGAEPDVYEIMVVSFRSTSGLQEAKNRNARNFADKYLEAADEIIIYS